VHRRAERSYGFYERYDVLWPLVRWGTLDRGGRYRHSVTVVVPFYSSVKTRDRDGRLVAHRTKVLGSGSERDTRPGHEASGWSALWTLLRKRTGPKSDELRLFPLYWRTRHYATTRKDPEHATTFVRVLWPLVWLTWRQLNPAHQTFSTVVAPFYWQHSDRYAGADGTVRTGRRLSIWPLFTWERGPDGDRHFWMLSRTFPDITGGYKRNYRPFFDLFQTHRYADGERETRLLWRLYHSRSGPHGRYLSLASLFTYDGTGEVAGQRGKYVSLLFGLIKYSWTAEAARWRLLYIPFGGGAAQQAEGRHGEGD